MKNKRSIFNYSGRWGFALYGLLAIFSCEGYLDEKPDQALVVPTELDELESLLDNGTIMTETPSLQFLLTDEVLVPDQNYLNLTDLERNVYRWGLDPLKEAATLICWNKSYQQVFYSNVVLDILGDAEGEPFSERKRNLKGRALFSRSHAFFQLTVVFAEAPNASKEGAGIPLPQTSNVNRVADVSSLAETFEVILSDLLLAQELLPDRSELASQPTKASAWALLSRIYLYLGMWEEAEIYGENVLAEGNFLLDFNDLNHDIGNPFLPFGQEVLYHSRWISYRFISSSAINPDLVSEYKDGDLRKDIFFTKRTNGEWAMTGNLTGTSSMFSGISLSEVYLNVIESKARLKKEEAATLLNQLRLMRMEENSYEPISSFNQVDLIDEVLEERRKELVYRGVRFGDLKRLNRLPGESIRLSRQIAGATLILEPNDPRYVFPFPQDEQDMNPNLQ